MHLGDPAGVASWAAAPAPWPPRPGSGPCPPRASVCPRPWALGVEELLQELFRGRHPPRRGTQSSRDPRLAPDGPATTSLLTPRLATGGPGQGC